MNSEFLDQHQYRLDGIKSYEAVWGEGFVSPGGATKAREMIASMELEKNSLVLDVGCGSGGNAFLMVDEFDLVVHGIDLSQNMIGQARARCQARGLGDRVRLTHMDCLELESVDVYDAVYSRDAFLHIHNKKRLFSVLHRSLKSGGRVLFTDYCCGPVPWSDSFCHYVDQLSYCLHTLEEYTDLVAQVGFVQIETRDLTEQFIESLRADLLKMASMPGSESLQQGWQAKLKRAQAGEQRWGMVSARKA